MADCNLKLEYKIKEITAKLDELHNTILLTEIVEFCGRNDLLEYKVSVDILREALNFYFEYKNRQKGKWILDKSHNTAFEWNEYKCSNCFYTVMTRDIKGHNFCSCCGAEMEGVKE